MPMRSTNDTSSAGALAPRSTAGRFKRALARHGIKAGIIASGAVVAVSTLNQTTSFLPKTTLVHQLVDRDSSIDQRPSTLLKAVVSTASPTRANELDIGVQHARIDFWVKQLTTKLSSGFETALGRKDKYADMIGAKLAAKQMPRDLIYLAMIESQFDPSAKSPVHAVGMWQFMSATARRFGLTVRGRVDERKDPARATDAAVAYLSSLYDRFGSWYLAAAAYNSGEGTVLRALQKVTGKSDGTDEDFFKILPVLPKETQDYVPKLIASARVGNNPEKYGLTAHPAVELASAAPEKPVLREVSEKVRTRIAPSKPKPTSSTTSKATRRGTAKPKVSRSTPRQSRTSATARHGRRSARTR